jgi:type I restriction enzyme S subunit
MQGSKKNILLTNYAEDMLSEYIFSTGFMGIECLNNSINYLWEVINSEDFQSRKDALSTGTLMAGISNSTIINYKYLIPTEKVLNKFNDIMTIINNKIYNNQIQNETLTQLRDTLLPKLMNGEIDLENIEI